MAAPLVQATGRRKESVARVRLYEGSGQITLNDRPIEDYFPTIARRIRVLEPLEITSTRGRYDVSATLHGGGVTGQADALRLGIARALATIEPGLRITLKKQGSCVGTRGWWSVRSTVSRKPGALPSTQALTLPGPTGRQARGFGETPGPLRHRWHQRHSRPRSHRRTGLPSRHGNRPVGRQWQSSGRDGYPSLGSGTLYALRAGLKTAGVEPVDLGVIPAGGISHLTVAAGAVMGWSSRRPTIRRPTTGSSCWDPTAPSSATTWRQRSPGVSRRGSMNGRRGMGVPSDRSGPRAWRSTWTGWRARCQPTSPGCRWWSTAPTGPPSGRRPGFSAPWGWRPRPPQPARTDRASTISAAPLIPSGLQPGPGGESGSPWTGTPIA